MSIIRKGTFQDQGLYRNAGLYDSAFIRT